MFLDRTELREGKPFNRRIREAVDDADGFVFLISPDSVAVGSYARTELEYAEKKWPDPSGRVLAVMTRPTDLKAVPPYLKALTFVETAGNLPAKVASAVAGWRDGAEVEAPARAPGERAPVDTWKLLAAFVFFFVLQAFGYAKGLGTPVPATLVEAVGHGFAHLGHIFLPWAPQAWPLAPTLCGLLILYAVHLPAQLRGDQGSALRVNRWFFSLLVAVTITTLGAFFFRFSFSQGGSPSGLLKGRLLYLTLVSSYAVIAYFLSRRWVDRLSRKPWNEAPWPEIIAPASIAWLLLMSVLGSQFDGSVDGALATAAAPPGD